MTAAQTAYVNSLKKQIASARTCADVEAIAANGVLALTTMSSSATATIAAISSLMASPTDLPSCITWIAAAAAKYIEQNATLVSVVSGCATGEAEIATALATAKSNLHCS
jgi:hypothetical protein